MVKEVIAAGLRPCCGGIFGLGESQQQRIEMAYTLKRLGIDSVPVNILNPIKGTALENVQPPSPWEILRIFFSPSLYFAESPNTHGRRTGNKSPFHASLRINGRCRRPYDRRLFDDKRK